MGETISTLVFRPPKPTQIDPNDYFYLHVDVTRPLYHSHRGFSSSDSNNCGPNPATCGGGMMCGEDSDLISLDRGFLDQDGLCVSDNIPEVGCKSACASTVSTLSHSLGVKGKGSKIQYKVPAFFVRRRGAQHTILFSHGNAEDLGMMYKRMKDIALILCVNVMAYDYTGYGLSTVEEGDSNEFVESEKKKGKKRLLKSLNVPSENMIYRNIEAAYAYLTEIRGIPSRNIILYGRSIGSGPSCYLAAKTALAGETVGGLILHSPFLSVYKVVADVGVDVRGDMFNNERRAGNIRCPTLIIHGKEDEVVPFWHAPRLLAAIPPQFRAQPFYVDGVGHNHIESRKRDQYIRVITEFVMKCVPSVDEVDHTRNVVPESERASPDEARQNESTFYINQTWMRHAKVICQEVFSDNIICNSALTVVDWSSGSSGTGESDIRECNENRHNGNVNTSNLHGSKNPIESRDDIDEFGPWKKEESQQDQRRGRSRTRRTHGDAQPSEKKKPLRINTKSSSMPRNNGRKGMKVNMTSSTRRRKSGGLLGFRK